MRISQHALDAVHRLEDKVFGAKLTPQGRITACDIVQRAIDLGDRQNESALVGDYTNDPSYTFKNGKWERWEHPQMQLALLPESTLTLTVNTEANLGRG